MRWFAWGLVVGCTFAPSPRAPKCIDELWVIDDPRGLHLQCSPNAEMEIEGHAVRCVCNPGRNTRLAGE